MVRLFIVFALLLGCYGCHDDPPVNYPTTVSGFDETRVPLGEGDKFNLTVFYGSKSISAGYTLDETGTIAVQYIGAVVAKGKTLQELQDEIQKRLADGYLQNPIVALNLVELNSLVCSVSGMVSKTGTIHYRPGLTITDVIADSGGFTPLARKNMVKVVRMSAGHEEIYKLPVERIQEGERPNFPMMPGDDVFVPERPW